MKNRLIITKFGFLSILFLNACTSTESTSVATSATKLPATSVKVNQLTHTPIESTSVTTSTTEYSLPTVTVAQPTYTPDVQPTHTPDTEMLIEAATLFSADFENGYPPGLYVGKQIFRIETEDDGNSIFCKEIGNEGSGFLFGLDEWENYAISLRIKFLSANEDQSADTYIRMNQWGEGYRASIDAYEWTGLWFDPPYSDLGGSPVSISQDEWFRVELRFVGDNLKYLLNGEMVIEVSDDSRTSGQAGFSADANTAVCVDDIIVWGLDERGYPIENSVELVVKPFDGTVYTLSEKIDNKPTVPVFYAWAKIDFYSDTGDTPYDSHYSLIWTGNGVARDVESTQPSVPPEQSDHMRSAGDTIYLINEEWHYMEEGWRFLASDSRFYLDEVFGFQSEHPDSKVINFEHPEWPDLLAEKAYNFMNAGFDGIMFDWWHNGAGNGRNEKDVEVARIAISKAIREKVGDDFIIMGNVNWNVDDPTAQYISGVFLELWKPHPSKGYALTYSDENISGWNPSLERMEDLLIYWNTNLQWPKIIAFEPWKITTDDYVADRYTEENYEYAKLFAAMAVVIPDNGYILYADNNEDWDGGDHQHAYYDFYLIDLGKPISTMVEVVEGVAYKQFERGIIAYNRTISEVDITLPNGKQFRIDPIEGLFLEGY